MTLSKIRDSSSQESLVPHHPVPTNQSVARRRLRPDLLAALPCASSGWKSTASEGNKVGQALWLWSNSASSCSSCSCAPPPVS